MSTLTIDIAADDSLEYTTHLHDLTAELSVTAVDTGGRQGGGNIETTFTGSRQELTVVATRYAGVDISDGVPFYTDMIKD